MALRDCIAATASHSPEAVAILAPRLAPITYTRLLNQIDYVGSTLKSLGIGFGDRVVVLLPDGPDAAVILFGVASTATCIPLDPRSTAGEFRDHLTRLRAAALILPSGSASVADVARQADVAVIELIPSDKEAGVFRLSSTNVRASRPAVPGSASECHVALILQTSGTTSQSKFVPLTVANIHAATLRVRNALSLTAADRYLNITSLFYSQGVMLTFASLAAGGSVVCPSGFSAQAFLAWTREFSPTWYSAAPALHQAILTHARRADHAAARPRFRFIRSAAAALPPSLHRELEDWFQSPVLEAYGMTECYPISSNRLGTGEHRPGSAGLAAGTDIAVLSDGGALLPPGAIGEIGVKGPHVTHGYLNESETDSFVSGWFKTGDQGYMDHDGFLFIAGRVKEIINRGGQKISPLEIDQVLASHPAVSEAAAFAIPHTTLGEDVAVVIVLHDHASITEEDIRAFAGSRLAQHKIPRRIIFLNEIPRSAAGKIQRSELTRRFAALPRTQAVQPDAGSSPANSPGLHDMLRAIWIDLLGVESVGLHDGFFDLGGNSLLAVEVIVRIENQLGKAVPLVGFLEAPTIERLAELIASETQPASARELVPVRSKGSDIPFFWVHGDSSTWFLASQLDAQQPVYGLEHQSRDGRRAQFTTVETIAAHYIEEVRKVQAVGPYLLGGFSFGGTIAFEMAQQLRRREEQVSLLVLLDPEFPGYDGNSDRVSAPAPITSVGRHLRAVRALKPHDAWQYMVVRVKGLLDHYWSTVLEPAKGLLARTYVALGRPIPVWLLSRYLLRIYQNARMIYRAGPYAGHVVYVKSKSRTERARAAWAGVLRGPVDWHEVPGRHTELIKQSYASAWIDIVKSELEKIRQGAGAALG